MKIYVVVTIFNEENFIEDSLKSLLDQTYQAKKILVVDDNSTDRTHEIVQKIESQSSILKLIKYSSKTGHSPGKKVIEGFKFGLKQLDENYDIICKFDGDVTFPINYFEKIIYHYKRNPKIGMVSGLCFVKENQKWVYENIASKNHIRGPIKSYRKKCFESIGGLKSSEGWDTVDELIALHRGWEFYTDKMLKVKHLKATGSNYEKSVKFNEGKALYKIRSGIIITLISAFKRAFNKKRISIFFYCIIGFFKAILKNESFIVTKEEGRFIRNHRWKSIYKRLTSFTIMNINKK